MKIIQQGRITDMRPVSSIGGCALFLDGGNRVAAYCSVEWFEKWRPQFGDYLVQTEDEQLHLYVSHEVKPWPAAQVHYHGRQIHRFKRRRRL